MSCWLHHELDQSNPGLHQVRLDWSRQFCLPYTVWWAGWDHQLLWVCKFQIVNQREGFSLFFQPLLLLWEPMVSKNQWKIVAHPDHVILVIVVYFFSSISLASFLRILAWIAAYFPDLEHSEEFLIPYLWYFFTKYRNTASAHCPIPQYRIPHNILNTLPTSTCCRRQVCRLPVKSANYSFKMTFTCLISQENSNLTLTIVSFRY